MKELEDLDVLPAWLRRFQMEFIGWFAVRCGIYRPLVDHWRSAGGPGPVRLDLCSGSGEPAISVHRKFGGAHDLVLSDRYPQPVPSNARITCINADARTLELDSNTSYTMFNAFHHFDRAEQQRLIARVRDAKADAWFVEPLRPGPFCFCQVALATTVGVLLLTPFVRPFSWMRIVMTYLLPVVPLAIAWDGLVSVFRSRSPRYYKRLFDAPNVQVGSLGLLVPLTVIHVRR